MREAAPTSRLATAREPRFAGGRPICMLIGILLMIGACSAPPPAGETGGAGSGSRAGSESGETNPDGAPNDPSNGIAGPGLADEPDAGPAPFAPNIGDLETERELGLAILHARALREALGQNAWLRAELPRYSFQNSARIQFEFRNPLGRELELPAPSEGLTVELSWEVERWMPMGGRDRQVHSRIARLEGGSLFLGPGESYSQEIDFPLEVEYAPSAFWDVRLGARLLTNGAVLGDQAVPLRQVALQPTRFLVFPDGWQRYQNDPLGHLDYALSLAKSAADRHILVSVGLLTPADREQGLARLIGALAEGPTPERTRTLTAALTWLSGEDLGASPIAWSQWWDNRESP